MAGFEKFILCIDDDEEDAIWIEEAISQVDPMLDVFVKQNGKEAIEFLNKLKANNYLPCLILLDVNMPLMNGKETLILIKNDEQLKNIPIVIFSTSNSKADQYFFEKHGTDFFTKPSNFEELKRKIHQVVTARCA